MAIKLKGHETFTLREGWLNKGLIEVNKNNRVFSVNLGADALGVGSGMAKAIRYWLKAGEFITESSKTGASLTNIGQMILENDKYIEDNFALWIFHINLAWNKDMATSWYLFFNEVNIEEFTKDELVEQLIYKVVGIADGKNIPEGSVRSDATVILNMYIKEKIDNYDPEEKKVSPFSKLGLIKKNGNRYQKTQPVNSELNEMVVLYAIQKYLAFVGKDSVGIDELLNEVLAPGKILNLRRVALNEYIDSLAMQGYLTVNRTAGLDMVYIKTQMAPEDIVAEYYQMS